MRLISRVAAGLLVVTLGGCAPESESDVARPSTAETETAAATESAPVTPVTVGSIMPDFTARNLDGSEFQWASLKGRPVLLNLWATWCGPCRAEIPELERLHRKHDPTGFTVLGVSVDDPSAVPSIPAFLAQYGVTYPNVHDAEGTVADLFNATALPTSALIDRTGKVVWAKVGIIRFNDPELEKALEMVSAIP